jgi:Big-like domain-containing protein
VAAASPKVILASLAVAAVAVSVAVLAVNSSGPAQATAEPLGGTWQNSAVVPGTAGLNSGDLATVGTVACPSPGNCSAVGYYTTSAGTERVFVAGEANGAWGKAATAAGIPGIGNGEITVPALSCASAGNCAAGGSFAGGTSTDGNRADAFLLSESGGKWASARLLTGLGLPGGSDAVTSVACPAAGDCVAVGTYDNAADLFVVNQENGSWQSARHLIGTDLSVYYGSPRVACAAAGNCFVTAGGYVAAETGGTWGAVSQLPGGLTALALSCVRGGDCTAGGTNGTDAEVDTEKGGTWGTPAVLPQSINAGGYAKVTAVSCASDGNCGAVGSYSTSGDLAEPFVAGEESGTWQAITQVQQSLASVGSMTAISCPATGDCGAISDDGYVVSEVGGIWRTGQAIPGTTAFTTDPAAISCPTVDFCAVGGESGQQAFTASEEAATTTALGLSAAAVTYGDERAERLSVSVASKSAGTPGGEVVISQGATTICTITLASGKGGCALKPARFAAGRHVLTASYRGAAQFLSSSSPVAVLTVSQAKTTTGLGLSSASVRYGKENSLRISVGAASQYGGSLSGTVTVKANGAAVCSITLKSAKGTCVLAARKLSVGSYTITAAFAANQDFLASASGRKKLTITK